MSYFASTASLAVATSSRAAVSFRASFAAQKLSSATLPARRDISSTAGKEMGPIEAAKRTLKKVDRVVSNAAIKGIDTGERARDMIKGSASTASKDTKTKAEKGTADQADKGNAHSKENMRRG